MAEELRKSIKAELNNKIQNLLQFTSFHIEEKEYKIKTITLNQKHSNKVQCIKLLFGWMLSIVEWLFDVYLYLIWAML